MVTIQLHATQKGSGLDFQVDESAQAILPQTEESAHGGISAMTYIKYFRAGAGWPLLLCTTAIFVAGEVGLSITTLPPPLTSPSLSPCLLRQPLCFPTGGLQIGGLGQHPRPQLVHPSAFPLHLGLRVPRRMLR